MSEFFTVKTQITRTTDGAGKRRRITEELSHFQHLAEKSFLSGKHSLAPASTIVLFDNAETVYLSSDTPVDVAIVNSTTLVVEYTLMNTRLFSFDLSVGTYALSVTNNDPESAAALSWFSFDDFLNGTVTTPTMTLQEQIDANTNAIAALTADILAILDGAWPFSLASALPDSSVLATFLLPFDMDIKLQSTTLAESISAPTSATTFDILLNSLSIGTVAFDASGTGTVSVPTLVAGNKGDRLQFVSTTINGMTSPSFTLEVDRRIS